MSFVGTRPEATKYVEKYSNEMLAMAAVLVVSSPGTLFFPSMHLPGMASLQV